MRENTDTRNNRPFFDEGTYSRNTVGNNDSRLNPTSFISGLSFGLKSDEKVAEEFIKRIDNRSKDPSSLNVFYPVGDRGDVNFVSQAIRSLIIDAIPVEDHYSIFDEGAVREIQNNIKYMNVHTLPLNEDQRTRAMVPSDDRASVSILPRAGTFEDSIAEIPPCRLNIVLMDSLLNRTAYPFEFLINMNNILDTKGIVFFRELLAEPESPASKALDMCVDAEDSFKKNQTGPFSSIRYPGRGQSKVTNRKWLERNIGKAGFDLRYLPQIKPVNIRAQGSFDGSYLGIERRIIERIGVLFKKAQNSEN